MAETLTETTSVSTPATDMDRSFWEDELETSLQKPLADAGNSRRMAAWVNKLSPRQRAVLCESLGVEAKKVKDQRAALKACNGELTPFYLVDQFAYRKSKFAVADLATKVLTPEQLDACRVKDDEYDVKALLYALYDNDPDNLRMVFHLDKIHKSGFARMTLDKPPRQPDQTFEEFLTTDRAREMLANFDAAKRDRRHSELKNIIRHDHHHLVFIRRPERSQYILRDDHIQHGHRAEWIILDFAGNCRRVNISSISPDVPLEIANALATAYYGRDVEYDNEREVTYRQQIVRFLDQLKAGNCQGLALCGMSLTNSPLHTCDLRLSHEDEDVVCRAVAAIERDHGSVTQDVDRVEGIKVEYYDKRIEIRFEALEADEEFIVRYFDSRLNALARKRFEDFMRETHGIPILSTEKRHKRRK
jgi:hypothetical protein